MRVSSGGSSRTSASAMADATGASAGPAHRRPAIAMVGRRWALAAVSIAALLAVVLAVGPKNIASGLAALRGGDIAAILALFLANFALVSLRLLVLLRQFGRRVSWSVAFRATAAGQAAGLFLFQVLGQLIGRQAILRHSGISPAATTAVTVLERIVLLAVAATLGSLGALHVFGGQAFASALAGIPWLEVALGGAVAVSLALWRTAGPSERRRLAPLLRRDRALGVLAVTGLTAAGQLLVMAGFVVGLRASSPETDGLSLLAAAAVVSFAAGLPISINGWGVRELAAVHVFGRLGVPAGEALAISIAVGLCATLVVVAAALPLAWSRRRVSAGGVASAEEDAPAAAEVIDDVAFTRIVVWLLLLGIGVLVFFQVPVSLLGSVTTINLADPLALVALTLFGLHCLAERRLPRWRSPGLNLWLLLAALAMLAAFAIGVWRFGVTAWALGNRLTGLLLLAGYLSAGALAVSVGGLRAQRQLAQTLLLAAATVTVVHLAMRSGAMAGLVDPGRIPYNFEAYSGNRNAYAFQMLLAVAAAAIWSPASARARTGIGLVLPMAIALLGVWLSQSRAGLVCAAVLLAIAVVTGAADRRTLLVSVSLVLGVIGLAELAGRIDAWPISALMRALSMAEAGLRMSLPPAVQIAADTERWVSLSSGLALWREHPLLGAGLGAFVHRHVAQTGTFLVIHNSLIWLLAEFGLIGTLPWIALFLAAALAAWRGLGRVPSRWAVATLGVLIAFGLASLVHDLLYQRLLWLLLGACLAVPDAAARVAGGPVGSDGTRRAGPDSERSRLGSTPARR